MFGLTKKSDAKISIKDLQNAMIAKNENNKDMDKTRMFCEVCRELASKNEMDVCIFLEAGLDIMAGKTTELMNAEFKKW